MKQYPLKPESRKELVMVIQKFLRYKLLIECESRYNTPILPFKRLIDEKDDRLVQDLLRAINQIVQGIHPVVANPYTLLTTLTEKREWFTVLDQKDAFFCIPLDPSSQEVFALEWENPETGRKTQYTWTVLPQGFKNSLTIFGNQLARELEIWKKENNQEILLKCMDDLLIVAETEEQRTKLTLNFLGIGRYRVSKEKKPK